MNFTAEELGFAAKRNGLFFPDHVLDHYETLTPELIRELLGRPREVPVKKRG